MTSLVGIDISSGMLSKASTRALNFQAEDSILKSSVQLVQADVASLPFKDNSFDTVVDTFGLCVFPDPLAALSEMKRVVKPNGKVLLLEHSRSQSNPFLAKYQDITSSTVSRLGHECVWNQNVHQLLHDAGLKIQESNEHFLGLITSLEATK